MKTQKEPKVCIRIINENIKNVMEGRALTMPLRKLNRDCRFKKLYFGYCDIVEGDLKKIMSKEYAKRPEVKQRKKEYRKEYYKKPEVKQRLKEYRNRQESKQRKKEYDKKRREAFKKNTSYNKVGVKKDE